MAKPPRNTRPRTSPANAKPATLVPEQSILQPEVPVAKIEQPPQPAAPPSAPEGAGTARRWLKMETGLSGPAICLSRGDKHAFDDTPGQDDTPSEAQRLIDAGFAIDTDPPADA